MYDGSCETTLKQWYTNHKTFNIKDVSNIAGQFY